jgi:hypothetical protein
MPQVRPLDTKSENIDRPLCDRCGQPMWLTRVVLEPQKNQQVFECAACDIAPPDVAKS